MKRGSRIEVARLPTTPDQLREDKQAGESEEAQNGRGGVLDFFEARGKFPPEDGDRDKSEEADACDGVGEPVGDFGPGKVGDGMEKD